MKLNYLKVLGIFLFLQTAHANTLFLSNVLGNSYISLKAGVMQINVNQRYQDLTDIIQQNIAESVQQNNETVILGLGSVFFQCDRYLLAAELSAGIPNDRHTHYASGAATAAFDDTLRLRYFYDLVLIPSLLIGDGTQIYAKFGYSVASIRDKVVSPTGFNPVYQTFEETKHRDGFVLGVGFELNVTKHVLLSTEYLFHKYIHATFPSFNNFTAVYSHKAQITTNMLTFGLSWCF